MEEIRTGREDNYFWLQALNVGNFQVVYGVPDILEGNQLAITSFDNGPLSLTEDEIKLGWRSVNKSGIAPIGVKLENIPVGGGDEWYIFKSTVPSDFKEVEVFADKIGFHFGEEFIDKKCQIRFWSQLNKLKPESYLADTNIFLFATESKALHGRILDFLHTYKV